ncbi:vacuolar sorting protein 3 isoform X1 [Coffea eugenioides]|uniref:vacuolar sorting protein 3 isoform X1 n=1 Tax=Coffea eugenioides TaxID=49369 RepID=UPI000F6100B7|nr:vacuolar sorting protein 3 isoform X1 [Coffea eugenioides]
MANPKSKSKPEPKYRPVIEPVAHFVFTPTTTHQHVFPAPTAIKALAISTTSSDTRQSLIYIGTLTGAIYLLSLNPAADENDRVSVIKHTLIGNGSAIVSILVVENLKRIIVLSGDGFLYLLDSFLLEAPKKVSVIKGGVTAFARRFFSKNYSNSDRILPKLNGVKSKEDGSSSISSSSSGGGSFFVAATGKKLVLAELVSSGSVVLLKEILGVFEGMIRDLAWVDDSIIFGNKSGYFLYSCISGQCGLIFSLPELSGQPQLKLLVRECRVLLLVDNVGVTVDTEGQPVGGSLVFRGVPDSIGEIGSHVVAVKNGKMELYYKKSGNCVQVVMLSSDAGGGTCVVASQEDVSGEFVAVSMSSKVIFYRKVPWEEQIKDLLRKKCFKEAISLVEELQSEGELTKETLSFIHAQVGFLLLFDLQFEEAVNHFLLSETMQPSELFPFIMRDPNPWSLLVPRNRYWGLHPPPTPLENVVDDGLKTIQRAIFLKKAGIETAVDDEFIVNPPTRADLLEAAIENFIRYMQASRHKDLTPSVREGVDTLLMYLYRALNHVDDMERLASSENSCIVEELEMLLNDSGHLRTLAFLYASKGMSSKALAIWRVLAKVTSGQETAVAEASNILEESSDQDLVLQHLGWIADINPVLAVQVLISDKRSNVLPPDEVIAAIDPKKVDILQRYLQWLIEDQDSDDIQFHTMYALLLAKSALESYEIEHGSQNSEAGTSKELNVSHHGSNSIFDSPLRERLQIFLQSSDLYDPEEVLDLIEGSELWLEKAILYRKLGQETLVLQILALKLEDCEAAEQYCAEIGRPDAYMQLLEMYLDPKDGKEPMFKAAVRLLHNHGEALDPLQVLERLSPDMPLQLASDTILRMLRARLHHHWQGQIVHNLSRALDVDASLARLEERSRHVLINDESVCDSCHARLGTKLFAMYPDDTIVCYKCFRRQGESTSVTGRNFKEDVLYKPGWLVTR